MAATYVAPALPGLRSAPRRHGSPALTGSAARPDRGTTGLGPGLRMTRRGRLAIVMVALLAVLLPGAWRAVATAQVEGPTTVAVTVEPGDTLWGIASALDPGADPRALIAEIRQANGLTEAGLVPGQVLQVPAR